MTRHSSTILRCIYDDLQQGRSLNTISHRHGIPKSTVFYYYQKLNGRKEPRSPLIPAYSLLEGEIVGIFAGDGSQYHDRDRWHYQVNVHFGAHNADYARYVQTLFETFFHKKFRLSVEKKSPSCVLRLRTTSKSIYWFFHTYLDFIPQTKHSTVTLRHAAFSREFNIGFIRGLVDTDGSVLFDAHDKAVRITLHTTSQELHVVCGTILHELGIAHTTYVLADPRGYKPVHVIRIRRRAVELFLQTIRPFKERYLYKTLTTPLTRAGRVV